MNVTVVNVALVVVESGLGLNVSALQWIAAGYPLAYGLVVIPAGRLGDVLGRRVMVALGLAVFVAGCVVGGLAWDGWSIVAARLLQGTAAGILNPQALSMLGDNYVGERRTSAFAMFGATVGVATALGPALGGLLLEAGGTSPDGWRILFWSNLPLAAVLLVATRRVRFAPRPRGSFDLDPVGLVLVGLGVVGLIAPFVGMTPGPEWTALAVAVAVAALLAPSAGSGGTRPAGGARSSTRRCSPGPGSATGCWSAGRTWRRCRRSASSSRCTCSSCSTCGRSRSA
ncbi:hypothetical protein BJF78_25600 [Pseudonocardia sp. CNS-139]|nr:hypothetical protein BJF78_25600 [Pseudonocardia sp. CNS-139]